MLIGIYLWIIGRIWLAGILAKRTQKTTHVAICSYHHRNVVLVAFGFWPSKHIAIFLTSSFRLMRVSIRFTGSRPRSGQEHKKKEHPKWNALKKIGGDLLFHRSPGSRAQRKLAFFAEMQGRRRSQQVQYHRRCEASAWLRKETWPANPSSELRVASTGSAAFGTECGRGVVCLRA